MKKLTILFFLFFPFSAFASSTFNLGSGWKLENIENDNYRGATLFYQGKYVYYFRTCAEQSSICDAVTSGLKAGKNGVFLEYFQGGGMDPGIFRITKEGRFV